MDRLKSQDPAAADQEAAYDTDQLSVEVSKVMASMMLDYDGETVSRLCHLALERLQLHFIENEINLVDTDVPIDDEELTLRWITTHLLMVGARFPMAMVIDNFEDNLADLDLIVIGRRIEDESDEDESPELPDDGSTSYFGSGAGAESENIASRVVDRKGQPVSGAAMHRFWASKGKGKAAIHRFTADHDGFEEPRTLLKWGDFDAEAAAIRKDDERIIRKAASETPSSLHVSLMEDIARWGTEPDDKAEMLNSVSVARARSRHSEQMARDEDAGIVQDAGERIAAAVIDRLRLNRNNGEFDLSNSEMREIAARVSVNLVSTIQSEMARFSAIVTGNLRSALRASEMAPKTFMPEPHNLFEIEPNEMTSAAAAMGATGSIMDPPPDYPPGQKSAVDLNVPSTKAHSEHG